MVLLMVVAASVYGTAMATASETPPVVVLPVWYARLELIVTAEALVTATPPTVQVFVASALANCAFNVQLAEAAAGLEILTLTSTGVLIVKVVAWRLKVTCAGGALNAETLPKGSVAALVPELVKLTPLASVSKIM
jgi:hypothetical protein